MTRQDLLDKLRRLADEAEQDWERAHLEADKALLAFLDDPEISAAYEAIERWYA